MKHELKADSVVAVARATAVLAAAEAGERGPRQSEGGSRPEAEFEAEGLDDDSIPEAMDEERKLFQESN